MPTQRSGQIAYSDLQGQYGGSNPIENAEYRGRDGSWNNGAMYNSDSYYVRPRPWFVPAPGPERLTFWFYFGGWYLRFNPSCVARGNTDFGRTSSTTMYFYGLKPSAGIPSQFDSIWQTNNIFGPWNGGYRTFGMQAHNQVSGYRATLGYWWQIG